MANTISNSAVGNTYFTTAGAPTNNSITGQPDVDAGSIAHSKSSSKFGNTALGTYPEPKDRVTTFKAASTSEAHPINVTTFSNDDTINSWDKVLGGDDSIRAQFTNGVLNNAQIGDIAYVKGAVGASADSINGFHKVKSLDTSGLEGLIFETKIKGAISLSNNGTIHKVVGTPGQLRAGKYIIPGVTTELAGSANSGILNASSRENFDVAYLRGLRTVRTSTAIASGLWNEYSGIFSTPPTESNDTSLINSDHAQTENHLSFTMGGTPTNDNYGG